MIIFKFHFCGPGEMTQCLKAIVTLCWGPKFTFQHSHDDSQWCVTTFSEDQTISSDWSLQALNTYMVHIFILGQNKHTLKYN